MINWINKDIFKTLEIIDQQAFCYFLKDLNPNWISYELDPILHHQLYAYFLSGGEISFRANSDGLLELIILINDIDPELLAKVDLGIAIVEAKNKRFTFELLIYDREDDPLRLPFMFELDDEYQRYCAAALCEQPEILLYFLASDSDRIKVLFSRPLVWSNELRDLFRKAVSRAYLSDVSDPELLASDIDPDELVANGWAYQFDLNTIRLEYGEEASRGLIQDVFVNCAKLISKCKNKGVQKGPYLMWLAQRNVIGSSGKLVEAIILFITPYYNNRAVRARKEFEPCIDFMRTISGYIQVEAANPILENAFPFFRYSDGNLERILVDEKFIAFVMKIKSR